MPDQPVAGIARPGSVGVQDEDRHPSGRAVGHGHPVPGPEAVVVQPDLRAVSQMGRRPNEPQFGAASASLQGLIEANLEARLKASVHGCRDGSDSVCKITRRRLRRLGE